MLREASTRIRLWNLDSNNKDQENLEAAEICFYRIILRIPWKPTKLMCQSFKQWDKSENCFVV